jgi:hypothetical protein
MGKKNRNQPANPTPAPQPVAANAPAAGTVPEEQVAWMDSSDPKKRLVGQIAYVGVWIYVAALCLLALDQTFHWGIFGPKLPPTP